MPSIDIKTLKLNTKIKDSIAEEVYQKTKKVIKIPSIEIYFNEYDSFYANGKPTEQNFITISFDGPVLPQEMITELCKVTHEAVKSIIDNCSNINFVYHANEHSHVGHEGKLLAELFHKKNNLWMNE